MAVFHHLLDAINHRLEVEENTTAHSQLLVKLSEIPKQRIQIYDIFKTVCPLLLNGLNVKQT